MNEVLVWRADMELLYAAALEMCLPCRQLMPLISQRVHQVAPNGISIFCAAEPINRLMALRALIEPSELPELCCHGG